MTSISQRAAANVQQMPRNANDRDRLREEWRLAAVDAVHAEDRAARAKEGKSIMFDQLVDALLEQNEKLSISKAERMARTSDQFKQYLHKMHDLKRDSDLAKINAEDKNRIYWEAVSMEANERIERRMNR